MLPHTLRWSANEVISEGFKIRASLDLALCADQNPVFLLFWTLMP